MLLRALRMQSRGFKVVSPENRACVRDEDLHVPLPRQLGGPPENPLGLVDGNPRATKVMRHAKSPSPACPAIAFTSTVSPSCSLSFFARAAPMLGMRASSFGSAFCNSRSVW